MAEEVAAVVRAEPQVVQSLVAALLVTLVIVWAAEMVAGHAAMGLGGAFVSGVDLTFEVAEEASRRLPQIEILWIWIAILLLPWQKRGGTD